MSTNYDELKPMIRSIVLALGRVANKYEFCRDYENVVGESFKSVLDTFHVDFWSFMKMIPDVCRVNERNGTIERVADEKSKHMNELTINKYKKNNRPRFIEGCFRSKFDSYHRSTFRMPTYTPRRPLPIRDLREKLPKKSQPPAPRVLSKLQKEPFRPPSRDPKTTFRPAQKISPPYLAKPPQSGLLAPHMLQPVKVYKAVKNDEENATVQQQTSESSEVAQQPNAAVQKKTSKERSKTFPDSSQQVGPGKENIAVNILDDYILTALEISDLTINEGSSHNFYQVKVMHCTNPSQFIIQFDCDNMYRLLNEMNTHYSRETLKPLFVAVPIVGMPVAVLVNGSWTRGSILGVEAGATAKIHLVDLGFDKIVPLDKLIYLKKSFAKYHKMTAMARLYGVKPEGEFWSHLAIEAFQMNIYKWKCSADIKKYHNECYQLILINDIVDANKFNNINKFMIDQRLAVPSNL